MNVELGFWAIGVLVFLLFMRIPIGVALIAVAMWGIWYLRGWGPAFGSLRTIPFDFVAHWTLSAVPMFVLMGAIAARGGLTAGLFDAMRVWLVRLPGGLAIATSFAGAGFAAICGSSLATTAAMGRIAVPQMLRQGYDVGLATGTAAAVGTIGALIPPSIIMVIYAVFAEVSVGKMLIAGVIPGLLTALAYSVLIVVRVILKPELAPRVQSDNVTFAKKIRALGQVWPIFAIAAGIVIAIYGGYATATEAGAIGATLTALLVWFRGKFTRSLISESASETAGTVASVFLIAIGATLLTQFLALTGMPAHLSSIMLEITSNQVQIILICCVLYLVLGAFLDPLGVMLLTLPILLPIFNAAGIDGIWAGVILVKMLEIGLLTPPLGLNVFVMKSVMGRSVDVNRIFGGVSWFLLAEIGVMTLLIAFPQIILFLPNLMG